MKYQGSVTLINAFRVSGVGVLLRYQFLAKIGQMPGQTSQARSSSCALSRTDAMEHRV